MASITIRKLDDRLKARLRVRAARHGKSMEEEAREILRTALAKHTAAPRNLAETIRIRFAQIGGMDFPATERDAMREPPDFD